MNEIVPLCGGALLGLLVGSVRPSWRPGIVVSLSVLLGVCASAVTGELSVSWGYVLVDIPLVAFSAAACFVARSGSRRRALARDPHA
jgi:hypothetical protein